MEELKVLVGMVEDLPGLAIAAIVAFYVYKVAILGSLYGVVRFVTQRVHDVLITKREEIKYVQVKNNKGLLPSTIEEAYLPLAREMERVASDTGYIHLSDVKKLRAALDAYEVKG